MSAASIAFAFLRATSSLLVRAIGFKRQTVACRGGSQSTADFSLEKDVLAARRRDGHRPGDDGRQAQRVDRDRVGLGRRARSTAPAKSLEGNLAGKVVGASIFENSGVPGGGMQIQIRGATSILGSGRSALRRRRRHRLECVGRRRSRRRSRARPARRRRRRTRRSTASPTSTRTTSRTSKFSSRRRRPPSTVRARRTASSSSRRRRARAGATRYNVTQRVGSRAGDAPPRARATSELRRRCSRVRLDASSAARRFDRQGELHADGASGTTGKASSTTYTTPSFETVHVVVGWRQQHEVTSRRSTTARRPASSRTPARA